jgi:hypothetical protein
MLRLHYCEHEQLLVTCSVITTRITVVHFVMYNLYLSGQLVRLALKVILQNDRNFMEVTHLQIISCYIIQHCHFVAQMQNYS